MWGYIASLAVLLVLALVPWIDDMARFWVLCATVLVVFVSAVGVMTARCPGCATTLPPTLPTRRWPGNPAMNFCPYCGVAMDSATGRPPP